MVFERKTFLEFADDIRYNLLSKAIKADSSSQCYEITQVPPQTASSTQNIISLGIPTAYTPPVFNNGSTHWIDI